MNNNAMNTADIDIDNLIKNMLSPECISNPYPVYKQLRTQPPVNGLLDYPPGTVPGVDTPYPAWVVTRYEDVDYVLRNPEIFSSEDPMQANSSAPSLMLVNHDKPRHTSLRNLAKMAFTPKRIHDDIVDRLRIDVNEIVDRSLNAEMDFMVEVAGVIPALVMTYLMGLPKEDYKLLVRWANAFMVSSDFTPEERQACNEELFHYFVANVEKRYQDIAAGIEVSDDLMTAFINAEYEGDVLTKQEVILFCITLVVAGAETTTYFIGNLLGVMLEDDSWFDKLKTDRKIIRPFMEECLRRDGPPQRLFRLVLQDCEISGQKIKAGDWVAFFMAAANHDESVFPDPEKFIIGRKNVSKHVTFGRGIHHCLGAPLARVEAEIMLNVILDKCDGIKGSITNSRRQSGGLLAYGFATLPLELVGKTA
ncbi:Putative cytochrome P450 YjiB [Zhongshania aliphaticivorans]|uniref:Cytochrome P450 YjiB n=1 Tax=Zhongshania aliphaticivorans TaxID=1470434 RepID=A0A5S9MY20_9GAMM|nr:cytochrome P450 [Zhongshania aliphaticivorans]CAA0081116.1 Putative cytochrome P450 YjiB [Zhongshania aliphaticivorans]CAA0085127.1 Putative cytochrome P450 YjiB [Zhongshania aliphaticivorans]